MADTKRQDVVLRARHVGTCGMCGETFQVGELVVIYKPVVVFVHMKCHNDYDWRGNT